MPIMRKMNLINVHFWTYLACKQVWPLVGMCKYRVCMGGKMSLFCQGGHK